MHASTTLRTGQRAPYALLIAAVATFLIMLLGLVASSPARADGPGEDHRVEASMGDDWLSQVACRDIAI